MSDRYETRLPSGTRVVRQNERSTFTVGTVYTAILGTLHRRIEPRRRRGMPPVDGFSRRGRLILAASRPPPRSRTHILIGTGWRTRTGEPAASLINPACHDRGLYGKCTRQFTIQSVSLHQNVGQNEKMSAGILQISRDHKSRR